MSAVAQSSGLAERERSRAAEMTIGKVTGHISRDSWPSRVSGTDVGPLEAWQEAEPIHYPTARRGAVARFHAPTETIMLARQGGLVTCYPLSNRPQTEQQYILSQVTDE